MYPLLVDTSPWSSISDSNHLPYRYAAECALGWESASSSFQDVALREQNPRFGVQLEGTRAVKEVRNRRCDNLFDLGGDEETHNTNKL